MHRLRMHRLQMATTCMPSASHGWHSACESLSPGVGDQESQLGHPSESTSGDGLDAAEPSPTQLHTDSKSARDVSYNPKHHTRMKHVERRHFYVRDMVESFELEVPFVPTDQNVADFFTKPMKNATRFREFRRIVMNERD